MQTLHQIQRAFEQYLKNHPVGLGPTELYEPVNYILGIGGKRLRPAVLLLAYSMYRDEIEKALPAAMAIEVFHNFTLLHDDIMDDAPLRRGKATVHEKYSLNTGILSGDVMLVQSYNYLLGLEEKSQLPEIMSVFTKAAIEVCEGQQMDMNFEEREDVEINEYLKMIELKTSVLVAAALKMGALLGGASLEEADLLYHFGKNLGIAFQLQDDLLDAYGDPKKFGKKVGGDIVQNKKTFLYLKALELSKPEQKAVLVRSFRSKTENEQAKIKQVKQVFDALDIKGHTEAAKERYRKKAFCYLENVGVEATRKEIMQRFAHSLMQRET